MATDTYYPNNGIHPPQTCADLVHVAMRCSKSHDESVAETKRLLGADVEPRHLSNNATEILQHIMLKLGPGGLWELLRAPPGQRHPAFDPNPNSPCGNGQVPGTPTSFCSSPICAWSLSTHGLHHVQLLATCAGCK